MAATIITRLIITVVLSSIKSLQTFIWILCIALEQNNGTDVFCPLTLTTEYFSADDY